MRLITCTCIDLRLSEEEESTCRVNLSWTWDTMVPMVHRERSLPLLGWFDLLVVRPTLCLAAGSSQRGRPNVVIFT